MFAGERSTVHWYDFEGRWAFDGIDLGKLTVHGMKQARSISHPLSYLHLPGNQATYCWHDTSGIVLSICRISFGSIFLVLFISTGVTFHSEDR